MYKTSYNLGELVSITSDVEGLSNKVGFVTRETRLTKKTNMAITWVHILGENCESPFLNTALTSVDT